MDKKKLSQLRPLKRELVLIDKRLDKLYERQENVPTVLGKVTGSSRNFPYTEVRTSVLMDEPKEMDEIDKQIVALLNKRAGHSLVIRGLKPGAHLGLYDAKREEEIFAKVSSYNEGPLYNENLCEIYATILKIMKETPSV